MTHLRYHRRKLFWPIGLLTLAILSLTFFDYVANHYKFHLNAAVEINLPFPAENRGEMKKIKMECPVMAGPLNGAWHLFSFIGDPIHDSSQLSYLQKEIKRFVSQRDTLKGIHIRFDRQANTFFQILDILNPEYSGRYILSGSGIWVHKFLGTELALHLEIDSIPSAIRFKAENVGKEKLVIVKYGCMGWTLNVDGPGGMFKPIPAPSIFVGCSSNDLIELQPGQSLEGIFDLTHFVSAHLPSDHYEYLWDTPGEYKIGLSYDSGFKRVRLANGAGFVYLPPIDKVEPAYFTIVVKRKFPTLQQIGITLAFSVVVIGGTYAALRISRNWRPLAAPDTNC